MFVSRLDRGKQVRAPKEGWTPQIGTGGGNGKGLTGSETGVSNKEAEVPCVQKVWNDSEGCWLLEKGENLEPMVVHTILIAEEMDDDGKDDEGKEGPV